MRDHRNEYRGSDRDFVQSNYFYNVISGTTFSGHPTKTTLGNTLRSILYAFFYIEQCGLRNPWKNKDIKVRASGDDVVILCRKEYTERIKNSILNLSSRVKNSDQPIGLGQCISAISSGKWYEFDFCSKWVLGTSTGNFSISRDIYKMLTTKQYYNN